MTILLSAPSCSQDLGRAGGHFLPSLFFLSSVPFPLSFRVVPGTLPIWWPRLLCKVYSSQVDAVSHLCFPLKVLLIASTSQAHPD